MATDPLRVWHDPGHGGGNRGVFHRVFYENDWVLEFTMDFVLRQGSDTNAKHIRARHRDEFTPYSSRGRRAEEWGADLAVLHHVNAMYYPKDHPCAGQADPATSGVSVFVAGGTGKVFDDAYQVGVDFLSHVREPLRLWGGRLEPHRSWRREPSGKAHWTSRALSHLRHYTARGIPAILIEWGFATSIYDQRLLLDRTQREHFYRPLESAIYELIERRK